MVVILGNIDAPSMSHCPGFLSPTRQALISACNILQWKDIIWQEVMIRVWEEWYPDMLVHMAGKTPRGKIVCCSIWHHVSWCCSGYRFAGSCSQVTKWWLNGVVMCLSLSWYAVCHSESTWTPPYWKWRCEWCPKYHSRDEYYESTFLWLKCCVNDITWRRVLEKYKRCDNSFYTYTLLILNIDTPTRHLRIMQ